MKIPEGSTDVIVTSVNKASATPYEDKVKLFNGSMVEPVD